MEVREHVERLRLTHPCGKDKLAVLLAREGIQVSASTVGRVLSELRARGVITPIGSARRAGNHRRLGAYRRHARRKRRGEKATRLGMLVQIDTLHEYSHTLRKRMHFSAVDPITRYAHAHRGLSGSSAAAALLRECLETWPHPITSIQVDNVLPAGAFACVCQERGIDLVTIPPATPEANAHGERLQRTFRDERYAYAHHPPSTWRGQRPPPGLPRQLQPRAPPPRPRHGHPHGVLSELGPHHAPNLLNAYSSLK